MITVLFVCLGNICRSPMAEAVFRKMVADEGLSDEISVDSCGTEEWNVGRPPHSGTAKILKRYGIQYDGIYASILSKEHFNYDYIIAMDEQNLSDIKEFGMRIKTKDGKRPEARLLSRYATGGGWVSVPDPWITGDFELTYELVSEGCAGFLAFIMKKHKLECR